MILPVWVRFGAVHEDRPGGLAWPFSTVRRTRQRHRRWTILESAEDAATARRAFPSVVRKAPGSVLDDILRPCRSAAAGADRRCGWANFVGSWGLEFLTAPSVSMKPRLGRFRRRVATGHHHWPDWRNCTGIHR